MKIADYEVPEDLYYDDYRKKWFVEAKRMRRPDP